MPFRFPLSCAGVLALTLATAALAQKPAPKQPPHRFGWVYPTHPKVSPAVIAHGKQLFETNCSFCHGEDARGGETGPNLVRSQLVLDDQQGEKIGVVVHNGRPSLGMPKFSLSDQDVASIAAFLHAQPLSNRGEPSRLDILVGNAAAGKAYFNGAGKCSSCHAVTGDMAGIGAKYDPKTIQNFIVSGGRGRRFGPRSAAGPKIPPTTVTVTLPSGEKVQGKLDRLSAFFVSLSETNGGYRSFTRHGDTPRVEVHNPLQAHIDMLPHWNDTDIHNLTAYLVTLK
jgi:mono/diheme cytochrome c family protein